MYFCKLNIARQIRPLLFRIRFHSTESKISLQTSKSSISDTHRIRNIGIMAHVDAGKTTLSESILYIANEISKMGNVDDGTTLLDFMPLEQERGITIRSACSTFKWRNNSINLIDTPGHSDFSLDVYRTMEVIDGCILVIDGSKNVEAQTVHIYSKLPRDVPMIIFVNKMDREGVLLNSTIKNIHERLKCNPLPLVSMTDDGSVIDVLNQSNDQLESIEAIKNKLIELDEELGNLYIKDTKICTLDIENALARQLKKGSVTPVFAGSAIRNKGTSILLDYICKLIPSPNDSYREGPCNIISPNQTSITTPGSSACYIFKIVIDKDRRLNCFIRVCYGELAPNTKLRNSTTNSTLQIDSIYKVKGNEHIKINRLVTGDIGMIYSTNDDFRAGQYLVSGKELSSVLDSDRFISCGYTTNQVSPVCFATLESERGVSESALYNSARLLSIEDPSITINYNPDEQDNLLIGALGELQLEIFLERLYREYGVRARLGQIQISYKERVTDPMEYDYDSEGIRIRLSICPLELPDINRYKEVEKESLSRKFSLSSHWDRDYQSQIHISLSSNSPDKKSVAINQSSLINELLNTAHNSLYNGPVKRGQIISCKLVVSILQENSPPSILKRHLNMAITNLLRQCKIELMEPAMRIDINTQVEYLGIITSHLTTNVEAEIWQVNPHPIDGLTLDITAMAKLSKLHGLSGRIKSLGRGHTTLTMIPIGYANTI